MHAEVRRSGNWRTHHLDRDCKHNKSAEVEEKIERLQQQMLEMQKS